MKKLLLTTSILALAATPALAASHESKTKATQSTAVESTMDNERGDATRPDVDIVGDQASSEKRDGVLAANDAADKMKTTSADASAIYASNVIGKAIYNGQDETIGDVNDLIIGQSGRVEAVIVGVGGFLGLGEKDVKLAFDDLSMERRGQENNLRIISNMTKEQLEQAPRFERQSSNERAEMNVNTDDKS